MIMSDITVARLFFVARGLGGTALAALFGLKLHHLHLELDRCFVQMS